MPLQAFKQSLNQAFGACEFLNQRSWSGGSAIRDIGLDVSLGQIVTTHSSARVVEYSNASGALQSTYTATPASFRFGSSHVGLDNLFWRVVTGIPSNIRSHNSSGTVINSWSLAAGQQANQVWFESNEVYTAYDDFSGPTTRHVEVFSTAGVSQRKWSVVGGTPTLIINNSEVYVVSFLGGQAQVEVFTTAGSLLRTFTLPATAGNRLCPFNNDFVVTGQIGSNETLLVSPTGSIKCTLDQPHDAFPCWQVSDEVYIGNESPATARLEVYKILTGLQVK